MSEESSVRRQALGRGLSALLGDEIKHHAEGDFGKLSKLIAIEQIQPNPNQPRQKFNESELKGLVNSIREVGLLQPIMVRQVPDKPDGQYEIVAGERRWRAAQRAQLHEVPVVIKQLDDSQTLKIALIENIQRQDLNPIEEAMGYQRLMEEFGFTQETVSLAIGRSRSHVANTLRLLALPNSIKLMIENAELSAGHGRALLGAEDPVGLSKTAVECGLNVRQLEALTKKIKATVSQDKVSLKVDPDRRALEHKLSEALGLNVSIQYLDTQQGSIKIQYRTLEQLDGVCSRLLNRNGLEVRAREDLNS